MLLGLDVGGTFTDGVAILDGKVVSVVKTPTTHENLLIGILTVIDQVVKEVGSLKFTRIALSTTVVTNALVEGTIDSVGLCIIPGPGMDISPILPVEPYVLSGYVDHRGHVIAEPRREEVVAACQHFDNLDIFAISGKFSVRNPCCELAVAQWVESQSNPAHVTMGSRMTGMLNFLRRTNSAYYNAAVYRKFNKFAKAAEKALISRGIYAPVYVLKADGGTLPLLAARQYPVEAIFTGPAASVLGIMALKATNVPTLSLDIGGTTTDLALWQNGAPLLAEDGASIGGFATSIRAFRLSSVGLGGDSFVRREEGVLKIGPMRCGAAMAVGGSSPTVTDAMIVTSLIDYGDRQLAVKAMNLISEPGQTASEVAEAVLDQAVSMICQSVTKMLGEQTERPVYRVEDIINPPRLVLEGIIGVGGAAPGLVPLVARRLGLEYVLPSQGMVANAIGAAVARPTIDITLRADTAAGYYTVPELGIKKKLPNGRFMLAEAYKLAADHLAELAGIRGICLGATEIIQSEEFNVIQGFRTVGKIITCRMQVKPGVTMDIKEGL